MNRLHWHNRIGERLELLMMRQAMAWNGKETYAQHKDKNTYQQEQQTVHNYSTMRAYAYAVDEDRGIQMQEKKQVRLVHRLWQPLFVSFVGIDKYTRDEKNRTQYYKTSTYYYGKSSKEIASEAYSENRFTHISDVLRNKLHRGFIYDEHYKISISQTLIDCQGECSPMRRLTLLTTLIVLILTTATTALAVTEFVSTINKTGEDYSTLTAWEAAIQCDLTAATTKVIAGSLTRGTILSMYFSSTDCTKRVFHRVSPNRTSAILLKNQYADQEYIQSSHDYSTKCDGLSFKEIAGQSNHESCLCQITNKMASTKMNTPHCHNRIGVAPESQGVAPFTVRRWVSRHKWRYSILLGVLVFFVSIASTTHAATEFVSTIEFPRTYGLSNLRHLSAVSTLKGKLPWWTRKCLFSVTRISEPVHSVYAAIKASAGFRPLVSYLNAISNGTTMSSSIIVRIFINFKNSLKASGVSLGWTSLTTKRGIRIVTLESFGSILRNFSQEGSFIGPKVKIYSLESRVSNKFLSPKFFSCFTDSVDNLLFTHAFKRRFCFRHKFLNFFQMFQCLFTIFHNLSPQYKFNIDRRRSQARTGYDDERSMQ